jgi:muramidase (phage lysozyme)
LPSVPAFNRKTLVAIGAVSVLLLPFGQGLHAERSNERLQQDDAIQTGLTKTEQVQELLAARPYRITPERRALLNTIRYAEGTWKDGRDLGYRVLYGGSLFRDLSRHPERLVVKRYASAAAGAYQFLPATWRQVARELKLPSFEPQHQDQAALRLVERRGALEEVDRRGLTPSAMHRLAPEWASFPTYAGTSAYGQPVKSQAELARFYSNNLREIRQGA